MSPRRTRVPLVACGVALILMVAPARSEACEALSWIWPWNWCRGAASATTYQPAYVAPSYMPTQTCSYVPQTAYRAVSRVIPTTTCMPVTYCDPCSGCPVTSYRPMTSLVRTTQLIPYTTYRMVWSNPCVSYASTSCGTACGTGCGTGCGTSYAPMAGTVSTTSSGCSSCGTSSTPSQAPYLGPTTTTPAPSTLTPSPEKSPSGSGAPPTFKDQKPVTEAPMGPIPDSDIQQNSFKKPQIIDPTNRTTAKPIVHADYVQPVSYDSASAERSVDYSGWRASR
jgi:hypothetical protein